MPCFEISISISHVTMPIPVIYFFRDQSDQFPHMERPLAVMFTTFSNRTDKVFIYTNTIKNWATFLPHIQPVLFTTFPSGPAVDAARANGWYVYPCPAVNEFNSPVMQAMYLKSYELFNASMYGFANGDIMFDWGLNDTIKKVTEHFDTFGHTLLFGLRYNFNVTEPEDYVDDPLWPQAKANELANSSKSILFRPQFGDAHDYFFISKDYPLNKTASVVVSREGFDTYLVSISNQMLLSTIDGTYTISAVHQTDKDGTMAHQLISNESDALYNRIMLGKEFRYGYGFSTNALHKTARRDGKIVIECNKKRKLRTGPCKTDQDLY